MLVGVGELGDGVPAEQQDLRAQRGTSGPGHERPDAPVGVLSHLRVDRRVPDHAAVVVEDRLGTGIDVADDEVEVDAVAAVGRVDDAAALEDLDEPVDVVGVVDERGEAVLADGPGHGVRIEQRELGALVPAGVVGHHDGPPSRQVAALHRAGQGRQRHPGALGAELDELDGAGGVVPGEDAPRGVDVEGAPGGRVEEAVQQGVARGGHHR